MPDSYPYPPETFYFTVRFDVAGVPRTDVNFKEVSGISMDINTESVAEGGENHFVHKLPSQAKYANLTLNRGVITDSRLIKWIQDSLESSNIKPGTVDVCLMDEMLNTLVSWRFDNVWPVKWSIESFDAQANECAIESLELAYDLVTRTKG